jgi:hypothetical protein
MPISFDKLLQGGTGQNQLNKAYIDNRAYASATAIDHDLVTFTDKYGVANTLTTMKLLALQPKNTTSGEQWQLGGDAANIICFGAVGDYLKVGPAGLILVVDPIDGIAVTATTADIMQVTPPTATNPVATLIVAGS